MNTIDTAMLTYENTKTGTTQLPRTKQELMGACKDFEALFVDMMLDEMRKSIDREGGLFQLNQAQEYYEDILYDEYAKNIAESGNLGLANILYKQLEPTLG